MPDHPIELKRNGYSIASFGNRSEQGREKGKRRPDEANPGQERDAFFEDVLRIENSREWRRLQGIYQFDVGQSYEFENRITHTVDVQNVGERIGRALNLDRDSIDLIRAIAAIHDIGHMPFGHWGERAADAKLKPFGRTWTHDAAGLRVVADWSNHDGLNLTLDTLEGLAKRYWHYDPTKPVSHFNHALDELPPSIREIDQKFGLHLDKHNHIEGQIAAIADWIAFTATDIEDGLRVGRMSLKEVCDHFPLAAEIFAELDEKSRTLQGAKAESYRIQLPKLLAGRIKERLIKDVVAQTQANIEREAASGHLAHAEDVRDLKELLVGYSPDMLQGLKSFARYCNEKPFKRTLEAHGPLQQMVEMTIQDIADGRLVLPPDWQAEHERIRASGNTREQQAALVELACTYMTCVMDDKSVMEHIQRQHPDFWQEHFSQRPAPPRISPAGVRLRMGENRTMPE